LSGAITIRFWTPIAATTGPAAGQAIARVERDALALEGVAALVVARKLVQGIPADQLKSTDTTAPRAAFPITAESNEADGERPNTTGSGCRRATSCRASTNTNIECLRLITMDQSVQKRRFNGRPRKTPFTSANSPSSATNISI
jgi:hypothetical protein